MKLSSLKLGFIGFGHMAQILLRSLIKAKGIPRSQIFFHRKDPSKIKKAEKEFHITSSSLEKLVEMSDVLLFNLRPHQVEEFFENLLDRSIFSSKIFISIAAGIRIDFYKRYLSCPIARVMPNISSEVGEGVSLISYQKDFGTDDKAIVRELFSCFGKVFEIEEKLMDAGCALSGSAPGFVFRLIEAASDFGIKRGFSREEALLISAQSFLGAAKLVLEKKDVKTLLEKIATPNGTTEAGLLLLEDLGISSSLQKVFARSEEKSLEMARGK